MSWDKDGSPSSVAWAGLFLGGLLAVVHLSGLTMTVNDLDRRLSSLEDRMAEIEYSESSTAAISRDLVFWAAIVGDEEAKGEITRRMEVLKQMLDQLEEEQ